MAPDALSPCEEERRENLVQQGLGAFADLVIETEQLAGLGRLRTGQQAEEFASAVGRLEHEQRTPPEAGAVAAFERAFADPEAESGEGFGAGHGAPPVAPPTALRRLAPEPAPFPRANTGAPAPAPFEPWDAPAPEPAPIAAPKERQTDPSEVLSRIGVSGAAHDALSRVIAASDRTEASVADDARTRFEDALSRLGIEAAPIFAEARAAAEARTPEPDLAETAAAWLAAALAAEDAPRRLPAGAVFAEREDGRSAVLLDPSRTARLRAEAEEAGLSPADLMSAWLEAAD